ncbi:hypothetical protein J6590_083625 [Homalodisca vitripennis]|nr:hypothetical protein J6590_083625 [Homalodisca vitripennis]
MSKLEVVKSLSRPGYCPVWGECKVSRLEVWWSFKQLEQICFAVLLVFQIMARYAVYRISDEVLDPRSNKVPAYPVLRK